MNLWNLHMEYQGGRSKRHKHHNFRKWWDI